MRPIEYIRKHIFGVSQEAFGDIAGRTQATVSRWEAGEWQPGLKEMARIREAARERGIEWCDDWFFAVPEQQGRSEAPAA